MSKKISDKQRLDWLGRGDNIEAIDKGAPGMWIEDATCSRHRNIRDAIDAAICAEKMQAGTRSGR